MQAEVDIAAQKHWEFVQIIFDHTLSRVFKLKGFRLKPMQRKGPVKDPHNMTLGYIDIAKKTIHLDILTPKRRQPKSINSLLRTVAHEIAHYQKPPYRQRYKGRYIIRQHYPAFYKQVSRNIDKIKKDPMLSQYFQG